MSLNQITITQKTVEILPDGRMNIPNACLYLGIRPAALARLRTEGTGPLYIKFDRHIFYFQSDLDDWIESKKKKRKINQL